MPPLRKPAKEWFSIDDIVEMFPIASKAPLSWCNRGLIEHYRFPNESGMGKILIPRDSLRRFFREMQLPLRIENETDFKVMVFGADTEWVDALACALPSSDCFRVQPTWNLVWMWEILREYVPQAVIVDQRINRKLAAGVIRHVKGAGERYAPIRWAVVTVEGPGPDPCEGLYEASWPRPARVEAVAELMRQWGEEWASVP